MKTKSRDSAVCWFSLGLLVLSGASMTAHAQCHYTYTTIPNPPGDRWCLGTAINNQGYVVGLIASGADTYSSFIWTPESGTVQLPMPPGVQDMRVHDINDHGHVVGEMSLGQGLQPFFWDGMKFTI